MTARAEEFVATLQNDPQLQTQLKAATTSEEAKRIVTDAGYGDVSSADVKSVIANQSGSDELTDQQLGAASGAGIGIGSPWGSVDISW
jgi:predicted ribosomally synthesized peptide with nif11-like leader